MSKAKQPASQCRMLAKTAHEGITIRDYFAAKAMNSMLLKYFDPKETAEDLIDGYEVIAMMCYDIADAMLKERDK